MYRLDNRMTAIFTYSKRGRYRFVYTYTSYEDLKNICPNLKMRGLAMHIRREFVLIEDKELTF